MIYQIGKTRIILDQHTTYIYLPSGESMTVPHEAQPGQMELARHIGYETAEQMNRDHDALHVLVAHLLGLKVSGPLSYGAGKRPMDPMWAHEEEIVLSMQKYMARAGVKIETILEPYKVK